MDKLEEDAKEGFEEIKDEIKNKLKGKQMKWNFPKVLKTFQSGIK